MKEAEDSEDQSIYHAASNLTERWHGTLKNYLRIYLSDESVKNNWEKLLPLAVFSCNTQPSTRGKISPFQLAFGRTDYFPIHQTKVTNLTTFESAYDEIRHQILKLNNIYHKRIAKSNIKNKRKWDEQSKNIDICPRRDCIMQSIRKKIARPSLRKGRNHRRDIEGILHSFNET